MIILRQKNYNIIGDIKHSGIKRTFKKRIGRARIKLAGRIDKSIKKDLDKKKAAENEGTKLSMELHKIPETTNLANTEKEKLSKKYNINIKNAEGENDLGLSSNNKNLIIPNPISLGELKHEEGHLRNSIGKNGIIKKVVNKLGQTKKTANDLAILDGIRDFPWLATKQGRKSNIISPELLNKTNKFFEDRKISNFIDRSIRGKLLIQDEKKCI